MINLREVITKYPECLESASKLRSYLVDLYPEEKARIRIIIDSFDCGVYEKIKNADIVDKLLINGLYNTLEKDYGYTHTLSEWCVNEWLQALGKSSAAENTVSPTTNKKAVSLTATTKTSKSNNAVQKQDDKFERNTSVFVNKEQQILQGELADLQNQEIAKLRGESVKHKGKYNKSQSVDWYWEYEKKKRVNTKSQDKGTMTHTSETTKKFRIGIGEDGFVLEWVFWVIAIFGYPVLFVAPTADGNFGRIILSLIGSVLVMVCHLPSIILWLIPDHKHYVRGSIIGLILSILSLIFGISTLASVL